MHTQGAGVDLLCGPDSPLPEARQRYRLLYHLGSGGQAEVYRGVRLSAGVSSSPVTVKVFRTDPARELLEQIRSWDKGDAVLMDLNSRGVSGICLRVDGFYGLPPGPVGTRVLSEERIPYQVLDYLPGGTLIDRLAGGASASGPARLRGVAVLDTLADTLAALHHPTEVGDSPVLHMDVKPANIIVLPDGEVRLIDFTTARYDHAAHITTIAHTPESAGPEAFTGQVGPSYDVHGFGSVAYYLVTGWLPRTDPARGVPGGLRRHPLLAEHPALAAHLLAPLADRPEDRPRTVELPEWITHLARLALAVPPEHRFVDWAHDPEQPGPTERFGAVPLLSEPRDEATRPVNGAAVRPVVARASVPAGSMGSLGSVDNTTVAGLGGSPGTRPPATRPLVAGPPTAPPPPNAPQTPGGSPRKESATAVAPTADKPPPPRISASARVPDRAPERKRSRFADADTAEEAAAAAKPEPQPAPPIDPHRFRRGWRLTRFGGMVAAGGWAVWAITVLIAHGDLATPISGAGIAAGGAVLTYWLTRLAGHLLRSTMNRGPRRGTLVPHLTTTLFLVLSGLQFLSYTPLAPNRIYAFFLSL